MSESTSIEDNLITNLRVLIVDNDPEVQFIHRELVVSWGHRPIVAQGVGDVLIDDARYKAKHHRCHIALVDMHLVDDYDPRDWSGLKLTPTLSPTVSIIVSGSGDRKSVVAALNEYGAFTFVGKEDHPEELRKAIAEAAHTISAPPYRPEITWPHNLPAVTMLKQMFPDQHDIPSDEADDVIGRLLQNHQRILLSALEDMGSQTSSSTMKYRRSCVMLAQVDQHRANWVIMLAPNDRITAEVENYEKYVRNDLSALFRPEMIGHAELWDIGAIAYRSAQNAGSRLAQTFTEFYRAANDAESICGPIRHFFSRDNWGVAYRQLEPISHSLFEAYDAIWKYPFSTQLDTWSKEPEQLVFDALGLELPNPTNWLSRRHTECRHIHTTYQAVTHGDLHGDSIFVNQDIALPIDFERTGPGPVLRDFVELTHDILTRIVREDSLPLEMVFALAVALCVPNSPDEPMPLTSVIEDHGEARKAFQVVQVIRELAHELARFDDQREFLWGLLLNSVFAMTLLQEDEVSRTRTSLIAAVICHRLGHWNTYKWPPRNWLQGQRRRYGLNQTNLPTVSPYVITGPTPIHMFFGREQELKHLIEHVTTTSYALIGGRRMGKSSILRLLEQVELPKINIQANSYQCQLLPSINPTREQFLQSVAEEWLAEEVFGQPTTFSEILTRLSSNSPRVFLIDEADALIPSDRATGWPLFGELRALSQSRDCQFIFAGERILAEAIKDSSSPLFNFATPTTVGRLTAEEVKILVIGPMRKLDIHIPAEDRVIQRIWETTSGHPNVVQRLCQRLIDLLNDRNDRRLLQDDVDTVIANPAFQRDDFYDVYLEQATVLERILPLILAEAGQGPYTLAQVRQLLYLRLGIVSPTDPKPKVTEINAALQRLAGLRAILDDTPSGYNFAVRAFPRLITSFGTVTLHDELTILAEKYRDYGDLTESEILSRSTT